MDIDWQNSLTEIKDRGQHLLHSEKWADCRFLVGISPTQRIIAGHKLLLAMASPVFERMFYGNLPPDKTDPIVIPDVQPEAFEAMLEYIYTDRITIGSFDKACELCYVAKKYMLPHVVTRCTHFLWADLSPKNACRAYEFAKLFDEPRLMQSSMDLIAANTREVLSDPSFLDIEVSTLMAILDQNRLNIDSELDLFNCLLKFTNERGILDESDQEDGPSSSRNTNCNTTSADKTDACKQIINDVVAISDDVVVEEIKMEPDVAAMVQHMHQDDDIANFEEHEPAASNSSSASSSASNVNIISAVADDVVIIDSDASGNANDEMNAAATAANMINIMDAQRTILDSAMLRQAVKKIRFLTMTPQQFAEGPARSKLLQQHEALAILIKISSPTLNDCRMPEGFCTSRSTRNFYESTHRQREIRSYRHAGGGGGATTSSGGGATCFPGTSQRSSGGGGGGVGGGVGGNGNGSGVGIMIEHGNQGPFGRTLNIGAGATLQRTSVPLSLANSLENINMPMSGSYFLDDPLPPLTDGPIPSSSSNAAPATLRCYSDPYDNPSGRAPGGGGGGGSSSNNTNNAASSNEHQDSPSFSSNSHASNTGGAGAAAATAGGGGGNRGASNSHNDMLRSYCMRSMNRQFDYRNTSVTDCGVTFQVDTNIWILGVQVPTQVLCGELMNSAGFTERYTEVLYAHIQDMHGSRITYTHCTARVRYDSLLDITFDRPVYIYRNQIYKIYVVFNKIGWYPMYSCVPDAICHRVKFMFNVGNPTESVRDGLIYAIIFSTPQDQGRHLAD